MKWVYNISVDIVSLIVLLGIYSPIWAYNIVLFYWVFVMGFGFFILGLICFLLIVSDEDELPEKMSKILTENSRLAMFNRYTNIGFVLLFAALGHWFIASMLGVYIFVFYVARKLAEPT